MLQEEQEDVALGLLGELLGLLLLGLLLLGLLLEELGRVDVRVHVVLALELDDVGVVLLVGAGSRSGRASSRRLMNGEWMSIRFSSDRQLSMKFSTVSSPNRSM